MIPRYKFTVVDNEAGMEHLSRKVLPKADVFVFVSDPTMTGVRTAARLSDLADEIGMKVDRRILVINNLISGDPAVLIQEAERLGLKEVLVINHDSAVTDCAMKGEKIEVPADSAFAKSVAQLSEIILK